MSTFPLQARPSPALSLPVAAGPWAIFAPVLGMAGAVLLMLLPTFGFGDAGPVYAAFSLGIATLYLALVPICERSGRAAMVLAVANAIAGIALVDWTSALHGWLSLQTVIAALWLLRDQNRGERALAGLILGLNAGAVAALGFSLSG
ncbi:hypothetical protein HPT27_08395 [Permianibacter sp. IMCC34836]|uniref:hypothetical protein n=1 Tax=Permianibacter fluminis TaxID=2738515 RepID=UPI001553E608|nr:hypothetical protein [Permianibacter fluminis]NQD37041.1 hypothetical protein [Permianibacter fluminis]